MKVLLTFFNCNGMMHHEFLLHGCTVTKEYYLKIMSRLREVLLGKRTELWKNPIRDHHLNHDNAPVHTPMLVRDFLGHNKIVIIPQSPYSSNLGSTEFFSLNGTEDTDERQVFGYD